MAAFMTIFGSVTGLIAGITAFFGFDATLWHSVLIYLATAFGLMTLGIALYAGHYGLTAQAMHGQHGKRVKPV